MEQFLSWKTQASLENIDKVHVNDSTVTRFIQQHEDPAIPVVIDGFAQGTPCVRWTVEQLLYKFRDVKFKCGEDDEGYSVRIKLKHFVQYCETEACHDDSPLYIFDSRFGERAKSLLADYTLPAWFSDDLFKLVGNKRRPPHRWFMIGPPRSGTGIHTDPLATSAWNMLLQVPRSQALSSCFCGYQA
eukprot:SAG11_NODE_485_length_9035_cov_16.221352_10_plen_187_part_00